jgi:hypothetical protein
MSGPTTREEFEALMEQLVATDAERKTRERLIAAAPDLLEALKAIRERVWDGEEARAEAMRMAETAIAKAEGSK